MGVLEIVDHLIQIILFFYKNSSISRNVVVNMIQLFQHFLVNIFLLHLKVAILEATKGQYEQQIDEIFKYYGNIFNYVNSEKKIFDVLDIRGLSIKHELIYVNTTLVRTTFDGTDIYEPKDIFLAYVPLKKSLKFFFQLPGVYAKVIDYLNQLYRDRSGIICNIVQTDLWKNMRSNCSSTLIPIYFYFDEFEGGNDLGSHAGKNKFGALYSYIACLPQDVASRLSSIIFTGLICAKDKKACTNEDVFKELIKDLNALRTEGLTIMVNEKRLKLYFQLVLVLGDNLGLNEIFDMTYSFKDSGWCRACYAASNESKVQSVENQNS